MSFISSVEAEFHKSPLLALSAAAAVVGAVVLVARSGNSGSPSTSPLDSTLNPQAGLAGGGGSSGGGGGAGLGQGDPNITGTTQGTVPVDSGTATAGLSASDVASAIAQSFSQLNQSLADSNAQLQGQINSLAGVISQGQGVSDAPRTAYTPAIPAAPSSDSGVLQQLLQRISALSRPVAEIAPQSALASQAITPAVPLAQQPKPISPTLASDGQSLWGQSARTINDFTATYGAGAAQAWVTQHQQELLNPPRPQVPSYDTQPAITGSPPPTLPPVISSLPQWTPPTQVVQLPQPAEPTPGVDYGPATITWPTGPATPEAAVNIARYEAQRQANPSSPPTPPPVQIVESQQQGSGSRLREF